MQDRTERLPPQSREAEKCFLGSLLREPEAFERSLDLVTPDSFYYDHHQKIHRALIAMFDAGTPLELVALADRLHREGELENAGGYPYLAELIDAVATGGLLEHYGRIVSEKKRLRDLLHLCQDVSADALANAAPSEELIAKLLAEAEAVGQVGQQLRVSTAAEATDRFFDEYDRRAADRGTSVVKTGLLDLDALTDGVHAGEFCILAARPGIGKSSLAMQIAMEASADPNGGSALYVSLEMRDTELMGRVLAGMADVNSRKIRSATLDRQELEAVIRAGRQARQHNLYIADQGTQKLSQIRSLASKLKRQANLKLIVIDYLQLIEVDDKRANRQEQVSGLSRGIKQMARDLGVSTLCLCQLNRQVESRGPTAEPRISELRESGSLEQDADTVWLLWPSTEPDASVPIQEVKLGVKKQRNGQTGEVVLMFRKAQVRFENSVLRNSDFR